jgi:hypothetical protein
MLLSSEEFSNFLGQGGDRPIEFVERLTSHFDDVTFYAVLRNEKELFYSQIREYIEGVGLPFGAGATLIRDHVREAYDKFARMCSVLDTKLKVIKYESVSKKCFCRDLLRKTTGLDVAIQEQYLNKTSEKGAKSLLGGIIRSLYANMYDDDIYSEQVRRLYEYTMAGVTVHEELGQQFEQDFKGWVDEIISQTLADEWRSRTMNSLMEIYLRTIKDN